MLRHVVMFRWADETSAAPTHDKERDEGAQMYGFMDRDMDGRLIPEEMPQRMRERFGENFARVDANAAGASPSPSSRSRMGLSASMRSISWLSSTVESCNRRMDCCSCGVSVRCCESRNCRVGFMVRGPPRAGGNGHCGYMRKCSPR